MKLEESVKPKLNKNAIQFLVRAVTILEQFLFIISSVILSLMVCVIVYGVVGRVFFQLPVAWTVEIAEYAIVFITFLAASWVLKKDGHVEVDIITSNVNVRTKTVMKRISFAIVMIASVLLFYFSASVTIDHFQRDVIMYNVTQLPKYLVLLPLPIGSLLLVMRSFLKMIGK